MKHSFYSAAICVSMLALLVETGHAHGGIYRGPPDIVPPAPGAGRGGGGIPGPAPGTGPGPTTPTPGGPHGPAPAAPGTGGPRGPGGSVGPATGRRDGIELTEDLTGWQYWWEFNKDAYLMLKDAIAARQPVSGGAEYWLGPTRKVDGNDTMAPTEPMKCEVILPALQRAIDAGDDHDIVSACMVAMAKIGRERPDCRLFEVFAPRLQSRSQELRETAALALGLAGIPDERSFAALIDLVADSAAGRALSAQAEVNDRTRSFAAYGLGLLARTTARPEDQERAFAALQPLLADQQGSSRNRQVAAIEAIGLLRPDTTTAAGQELRRRVLQSLADFYLAPLGVGEQLVQAHVPPVVAKLLGRTAVDDAVVAEWRARFVAELHGQIDERRRSRDLARSAALALGQMVPPCDDDRSPAAAICDQLLQHWRNHKDAQTRSFALLALGQIGGKRNRSALLREFDRAQKSLEKPWVAIALGVYAHGAYGAAAAAQQPFDSDDEIGRVLTGSLATIKDPMALSGIAVALGLCRYQPAVEPMRALLRQHQNKDDLAGYLCIGLALSGDTAARDDLRAVVANSVRRPDLLKQAAIALGKLGDKSVAEQLQAMLRDGDQNLARLSAIAAALGFIGDYRSVLPLRGVLLDDRLSGLSRAFAAVALGGVGDQRRLPWSSAIGQNCNYRAAVETLTDGSSGILDIL